MLMRCWGGPFDGEFFNIPADSRKLILYHPVRDDTYVECIYEVVHYGLYFGGGFNNIPCVSRALVYNENARNEIHELLVSLEFIYKFLGVIHK